MDEEQNNINNSKEKAKEGDDTKININNLNNFLNSKETNMPTLNIDKEQLFQSFLLFQNFLSMNKNIMNDNKTKILEQDNKIQNENISNNINTNTKISNLNDSKINKENENNNKIQNEKV